MGPVAAAAVDLGVNLASGAANAIFNNRKKQFKWMKKTAEYQNEMNRSNVLWQLDLDKRIQEEQRLYDSPSAQMQRFKDAGLNPNLIYGGGSHSAGGTFGIQASNVAPISTEVPSYSDSVGNFIAASQANATIRNTKARTELTNMQEQVQDTVRRINELDPMINPDIAKEVGNMMLQNASLSAARDSWMQRGWYEDGTGPNSYGALPYIAEIRNRIEGAYKDLKLQDADLQRRNQILESNEFMLKIQQLSKDFLEDFDLGPEGWRRIAMLLFSRFFGVGYGDSNVR